MADEAAQGTPTDEGTAPDPGGSGFDAPNRVGGAVQVAVAPTNLDRIDQLSGAIADLTFRVETLLGSTTAFRSSITDRLTDYADLVAKWSMETEGNLDGFRRTSERVAGDTRHVLTEAVALLRRVGDQAEALTTQSAVLEDRLADGLAAVAVDTTAQRTRIEDLAAELAERIQAAGPALQSLDDRSASLLDGVASLGQGLSHVDDRLAQLASAVVALAPVPLDLAPVVAGLQQRMQVELEVVIDRLSAIVTARPALTDQAAGLAALEEAVLSLSGAGPSAPAATPAEVEAVRVALVELRAELRELAERLAVTPEVPPEIQELAEELRAVRAELSSEAAAEASEAGLLPSQSADAALIEAVYGELQALRSDVAGSGQAIDGLTSLLETQQELLDELAGEVSALRAVQPAGGAPGGAGQPGLGHRRTRADRDQAPVSRSTRTGTSGKEAATKKAPASKKAAGASPTARKAAGEKATATKPTAKKTSAKNAAPAKAVATKAGAKRAAAASKRATEPAAPAKRATSTGSARRATPVPAARTMRGVTAGPAGLAGPAEPAQPPVVVERPSRTILSTAIDRPAPRPAPEVVRTASRPVPLPADEQPAPADPEVVRQVEPPEPTPARASAEQEPERPARRGLFRRRG